MVVHCGSKYDCTFFAFVIPSIIIPTTLDEVHRSDTVHLLIIFSRPATCVDLHLSSFLPFLKVTMSYFGKFTVC